MLRPGDKAPEFELPDELGNQRRLAELLSGGPVLLYFYPADFTPICTAQACALRDMVEKLDANNGPAPELVSQLEESAETVKVVGVSVQSVASHLRFKTQFDLPFTLLSDMDKIAVRAYGVTGPMGFGIRRATFLIDTSAVIRQRVVSDFFVGPHTSLLQDSAG